MKIGIVMDPIENIKVYKDTTLAMMLAAQREGWSLRYMLMEDLYLSDGQPFAQSRGIEVFDSEEKWFEMGAAENHPLSDLDAVLMRKDPPFDMEFIYATYILQRAMEAGVLVVNHPQGLRDANEKMFTAWFPQCCPPTLVTRSYGRLHGFLQMHKDVIVKPLDGMGGRSIFRLSVGDVNSNVIFETMTENENRFVMVQKFIPAISEGDKRILLINGVAIDYALARIPAKGEFRGNLAVGATSEGRSLTERDRWLCNQIAPELVKRGLIFVGLDVIGDYVTEINVTSPTCIRELDALYQLDIAKQLMEAIKLKKIDS